MIIIMLIAVSIEKLECPIGLSGWLDNMPNPCSCGIDKCVQCGGVLPPAHIDTHQCPACFKAPKADEQQKQRGRFGRIAGRLGL